MIEGYTTVKDIAEKWNIKPRTVQIMCAEGKLPGAVKFGRDWAIPVDAKRPSDGRFQKQCESVRRGENAIS